MLGHRRLIHFPKESLSFLTFYLQMQGDIAGMFNKLIDGAKIAGEANMLDDRVNIQKRSGQVRAMD